MWKEKISVSKNIYRLSLYYLTVPCCHQINTITKISKLVAEIEFLQLIDLYC